MYEDKNKSKKVYVESKCVSRDDCCGDETPEMITEVVAVKNNLNKPNDLLVGRRNCNYLLASPISFNIRSTSFSLCSLNCPRIHG